MAPITFRPRAGGRWANADFHVRTSRWLHRLTLTRSEQLRRAPRDARPAVQEPVLTQGNLEPIRPAEAKEMYLSQRESEVSKSTIQAHHYRLKHFVEWCEKVAEIDNLNELSGRDLQRYKMWRREDGELNNVTMVTQLSTLRVFVKWCENIDAVASGTHDKILMPSLAKTEDRRTAMLDEEAARRLIEYLRKVEFST